MIKKKSKVLLESHLESHGHIELFRQERKVTTASGMTKVNRPDDRTPDGTQGENEQSGREERYKKFEKVLTSRRSMIE